MKHKMAHCDRPWWKRPPVWFIGIAVVLLGVAVVEQTNKSSATPYSTFVDQIEAGNIASVTFQGTEIIGRYKHPVDHSPSSGTAQSDSFHTRIPDFGDPMLLPMLRTRHVVINVASPSAWTWLLGRVPWPMLIFIGVMLVIGLVRLVRGGSAQSGTSASTLPSHGIIGLVSRLFAKQQPDESPSTQDGEEPKGR